MAQFAGGDRFAATDDGLVRQLRGLLCRPREGLRQSLAETFHARLLGPQPLQFLVRHLEPEILQHRHRSQAAANLGRVCAQHAHAVAGQIHAWHRAAPILIHLRQPLARLLFEAEGAARQVGQLRLGA
ncbi:hypothetical protein D3C86_1717300 [compost metagenome]